MESLNTLPFKIVDSFLFSEIYEKELMLLKFRLENDCIAEWIILENSYSFQGEFTGLHAKNLIDSDSRFDQYKHKITIISKEKQTKVLPKHQMLDALSFQVEYWQRDLAYDYFMEKYDEEDWIMVSDVDEMIDFTSKPRKEELLKRMAASANGLLLVPTRRFWYDFDNEYQLIIGNAMCNKRYLVNTGKKLHHIRKENRRTMKKGWDNIIQFEYSSCYDVDYMLRKLYTSTHTGLSLYDLKQSLRCNHRPIFGSETNRPENNKKFLFETVVLNEKNSPEYVRQNLSFYKTNAIDIDYKKNRRIDYPEFYQLIPSAINHIKWIFRDQNKWLKRKYRNLLFRFKSIFNWR